MFARSCPGSERRGRGSVCLSFVEGGDGRAGPPLVRPEISDFEDQLDDDGQDTSRCLLAVNEPPAIDNNPALS